MAVLVTLSVIALIIHIMVTALQAARYIRWKRLDRTRRANENEVNAAENKSPSPELSPPIEPLFNFDWRATRPMKLRPFKPTYHITMALQATRPSDLIQIDNTYLHNITARRRILASHPSTVLGAIPSGHAPVRELYTYLIGKYLPARYPSMFDLLHTNPNDPYGKIIFRNKITGLISPLYPLPASPLEALKILGVTVEDDMFLLLRDPITGERGEDEEGGEHRAVAFICCHPSGFDPSTKLGKKLVDVHGPVPGYEKIGASMERVFGRLGVARGWKRVNWSIQTHPHIFAPSGNHIHAAEKDIVQEDSSIDPETARFRVELQTLTRLPETQAILFSFKTYLYPLAEIKAEGLGPQLADAIEGLRAGNTPGMWTYKGAARWGRAACEYMRA